MLVTAIFKVAPDILIAGGDLALAEVLSLHSQRMSRYGATDSVADLVRRSFGNPEAYPRLTDRTGFMKAAQDVGIRIPRTNAVVGPQATLRRARILGFPCVLKVDGSSGGSGTAIVQSSAEAIAAIGTLAVTHLRARTGALLRGQSSLRVFFSHPVSPIFSLQEFVPGKRATTAFACWKGEVVGAVHAEVVQESKPNGPATVVRVFSNSEMDDNARRIASLYRLSGVHGLDYILDARNNLPALIEMNPRLTQIAHFNFGDGRDPAFGIVRSLSTSPAAPRVRTLSSELVALIPQEMQRDPKSWYLVPEYQEPHWTADVDHEVGPQPDKKGRR